MLGWKNGLDWKIWLISVLPEVFSLDEYVLTLFRKKKTNLSCLYSQTVHPAISKSSKKIFFGTAKPFFGGSLKFRLLGFCREEVKPSKNGSCLL